jgi:hypothetical protein
MTETTHATFTSLNNDLYWKVFDRNYNYVRWIGYDDRNWWENVATQESWRRRVGSDGRVYTLDPETNRVRIADNEGERRG